MPNNTVPQYRRSKNSNREFIRINGNEITSVVNKQKVALISHQDNAMLAECCLADDDYVPVTEAEFHRAHMDALAICSTMKIV